MLDVLLGDRPYLNKVLADKDVVDMQKELECKMILAATDGKTLKQVLILDDLEESMKFWETEMISLFGEMCLKRIKKMTDIMEGTLDD